MEERIGVVVADADESFRALLNDVLESSGDFAVRACVGDGVSAREALRRTGADLLLTELTLPRLDGIGLLEELAQENCAARVVVLSGQTRLQTVENALQKGACFFMAKPCDMKSLLARLHETVHGWKRRVPEAPAEVEWSILSALYHLGMPPSDEGTMLARDMLLLTVRNPSLVRRPIKKRLFSRVLRSEEDNTDNIERVLRSAIEAAWKNGDREFQEKLFGATVKRESGRPSNADFIAVMTEYIRASLQYKYQHGADSTLPLDWTFIG